MARYKDCDKCYHRNVCMGDTDKWNYYGECPHYVNSADVVSKSEVETIQRMYGEKLEVAEALIATLNKTKTDVAREIFDEIEEIFNKRIAFYTDMAKQSKFTEKHYAETMITNCKIYLQEIAELKKKYTGEKECPQCKHFVGCEQANWVRGCEEYAERCVVCGEVIPEGRQVCPKCEMLH